MPAIARESLMTLEAYAKARPEFRSTVIAHKKLRSIALGDHVTLLFEDELTVRYQVQEMLRIEKIFEEEGLAHELESYNPLIPTGTAGVFGAAASMEGYAPASTPATIPPSEMPHIEMVF